MMKMKKLGRLLNYPNRLQQERRRKESEKLKKHPNLQVNHKKIQTLRMILILDRILKNLLLDSKRIQEGIIQMILILGET